MSVFVLGFFACVWERCMSGCSKKNHSDGFLPHDWIVGLQSAGSVTFCVCASVHVYMCAWLSKQYLTGAGGLIELMDLQSHNQNRTVGTSFPNIFETWHKLKNTMTYSFNSLRKYFISVKTMPVWLNTC